MSAFDATAEPLIGRDESWMQFNRRVLEEAQDPSNHCWNGLGFWPSRRSNMDEFVEIRVAGLLQRIEDGYATLAPRNDTGKHSTL